jgi:ssDNA-binding Zn-finger/Zn-ribbon topoisomerase 1
VIYDDELLDTILGYDVVRLSDEEVNDITYILNHKNMRNLIDDKTHVGNIRHNKQVIDHKVSEGICPKCGGTLIEKKGKFGDFYGCSNYPSCKIVIEDTPTHEVCPNCSSMMILKSDGTKYCYKHCEVNKEASSNVLCPKCGKGNLVPRVASKGKNKGNTFYGCSNYPKCKNFVSIEEYNELVKK